MEKPANTKYPIHELLQRRWSPRAFSDKMVEPSKLQSLLEAARWAASSYNEQPWSFIIATKENQTVHQDVSLYASVLEGGDRIKYDLPPNRHAWLHVARGSVTCNGYALTEGDAAAVSGQELLEISTSESAEFLLFNLA